MTVLPFLLRRCSSLCAAAALGAGLLSAPLTAQQITLTAPRAVSVLKPFSRLSESAHSLRDSLVAFTKRQLGVPYQRGEATPEDGFDCSGLAKYVMAEFGARLPRTSGEQALVGKKIERDIAFLKPGDLLTFGHGKRISHVAIYIGGGRYVHAPVPGGTVREESLAHTKSSWWKGARRVIALDEALGADSVLN